MLRRNGPGSKSVSVECPQYSIRLEALGICATVELSYNIFYKLNDFCTSLHKKALE